jgi:DNA helicase-2/ATP-dependent DNA helicase PcrA
MDVNFLSRLNESQAEAVKQTEGPVMIIAGAGSGKTRVLTYRVAYLLAQGVDPFNILALTFTNKAAREMRNRITTVTSDEARNLWMGTFHSIFARILRIEAERLNYPSNFTIYDTDDSKNLMKDILKEQGLDDKTYKPSVVLNRISSAKNNLISARDYADNTDLVNDDNSSGRPKISLLYELYQKRCFKAGAMDFDDLLFNTWLLLKNFPDILNKYQHKFRYVMVDEFQDTNFAQYVIVRKIAAQHQNICVVGDDAQSIYAFRGANIQNILSFEKDYPELKTYKLEQNYRSTKNIVNAANSLIEHNHGRLPKEVWTDNDHGDKIKVLRALSDNEEGHMVAQCIFSDRMNSQLLHKDFAILYRTNAQSRSMEEALRRNAIPYRIYGGLSFYKRKEIKDLLAYFRLAINPHDEESIKRVINYPGRGIGTTSVEKMVIAAARSEVSLWDVMLNIHSLAPDVASNTRSKIADFVTMIQSYQAMLNATSAYDLASHIASSTGLLKELYTDRTPEGISHYENLQELLNGIREFTDNGVMPIDLPAEVVDESAMRTLDMYMQDIALLTDSENKDDGDDDKVSLMTIHAAKGLEFKHVFVTGLEENLFPSQLSLHSRADLEEERRLFYVAITRAEKKLTLAYASSRYRWGNLISSDPSRFINEIHPQYLEQVAATPAKHYSDETENWSGFGRQQKPAYNNQPTRNTPVPVSSPPAGFKKLNQIKNAPPPPPSNPDFKAVDPAEITVGLEVEHERFGLGKVVALEGKSPDCKATIFFTANGNKQLLLKFAKLKILR